MLDGSDRVEFADVEVIGANTLLMMCRVGKSVVAVLPRPSLPGTTIERLGDRGCLVLLREEARNLGLL